MYSYIYNSRLPQHKQPFGAVAVGQEITFTIHMPKLYDPHAVLLVYRDGNLQEPFAVVPTHLCGWDDDHDFRECTFTPTQTGLYFYCFEADLEWARHRITKGVDNAAQLGGDSLWQLTVYDPNLQTSDFLKGGVLYQIFPDRFCKAQEHPPVQGRVLHEHWGELPKFLPDHDGEYRPNDYFGGDLAGITQRLDYLASLGVTAIYLNPIFEAHSNHRYNTADYRTIDPWLGTEEDFRLLCQKAKEQGIAIILDGVFSHTGSDSVYFNKEGRYGAGGAYQDAASPYRAWYNIKSNNSYDCWWGFKTLPNVKETEPSYLDFVCGEDGVARHWLALGAKGWRLDVADELPDEFLDQFTHAVKAFDPQALVLGEVWEDASNKSAYGVRRRYLLGGQLDSVMNYPFRNAVLALIRDQDAAKALDILLSILENYPKPTIDCLMNLLSTHDVERIITALGGEPIWGRGRQWQGEHHYLSEGEYDKGKQLFLLASVMQYTLPGTPSLYYGDEAGLFGYKDPFNRMCYPWGSEDEELILHFRSLGKLRKNPVFADGIFQPVQFEGGFAAYQRINERQKAFVVINATPQRKTFALPQGFSTEPALKCGKLCATYAEPFSAGVFLTI